jgi:hypothetical protein
MGQFSNFVYFKKAPAKPAQELVQTVAMFRLPVLSAFAQLMDITERAA